MRKIEMSGKDKPRYWSERNRGVQQDDRVRRTSRDLEVPVQTPSRDISTFDLEKFECKDFTTPKRSFVRRNIIKGPYNSVKDYLDIHFRLMREDFLGPIREDLCEYLNRKNGNMSNIEVHKNVRFCGTKYQKDKVLTVLQFKISEKLFKLLKSEEHKRFMYGSLLIFSNDGFKTLFTGKVMGTSDLLKGELDVEVGVFTGTFTMVECMIFYEPYFQVLSVIQKLKTIPMKRYIVNVETNVSRPNYMKRLSFYNPIPSFLNPSQRAAMHAALNKELVVIQGPPGTGKMFLGMELVKLLLSIKRDIKLEGPILIVTYTNHALDQFVDGLKRFTNKIVRLGHGSRSFAPEAEAKRLMCESLNISIDVEEIDNYIRYLSVRKRNPYRYELEAAYRGLPSDLKERLVEWRILNSHYRSLKAYEDSIDKTVREGMNYVKRRELLVEQERQRIDWKRYLSLKEMNNAKSLKKMDIVAMTTTKAAKMRSTLELVGCPILLVEEAAEVLESHVISALTTECQHLILLGDHQQLRPSTADYTIGKKYNLEISLFERLVQNILECHTLNVQHRMRPEISSLIHPLFYKELYNDRKVEEYPLVSGVKFPLYFIDHSEPEDAYDDTSKMNVHEAKFLIQLAIYLLHNNYEPEDITILAAYRGQMCEMKKQQSFCKNEKLQKVLIASVDNYQGEENKIILLSLVRNNKQGSVGFLSTGNRVCVALSRAKHGLYIMGNMNMLCASSKIWESIRSSLESQKAIGKYLPLYCKIRPEHQTLVSKVTDFKKVPNGGCTQRCNTNLKCGHTCDMICHAFNRDHKLYNCKQKCELFLCQNPRHLCRKLCFEACGPCNYPVERTFTCGHKTTIACSKDIHEEKCMEPKLINLVCGHETTIFCHQDEATLSIRCQKICRKTHPCGHICYKKCYEYCGRCTHLTRETAECGHIIEVQCNVPAMCHSRCRKKLDCGHPCLNKCGEPCEKICRLRVLLECGHEIIANCDAEIFPNMCTKKVLKILPCGHVYPGLVPCNQQIQMECVETVQYVLPCGHKQHARCQQKDIICTFYCIRKIPECGHPCQNLCNDPCTPQIKCTFPCDKQLECGHKCPNLCYQTCLEPHVCFYQCILL